MGNVTHVYRDGKVVIMKQAMIMKCPSFIMAPEHYKADGSCLCFDQAHQEKLRSARKTRTEKLLAAQKGGKHGPVL
uniref:Uncharacterized protein n=1 Tax=viral metagenome TaxID=1070528 RepID=A0A6H1ZYB4_9ZZZZ